MAEKQTMKPAMPMSQPKYDAGQKKTSASEGPKHSSDGNGHFTGK